MSHVHILWRTLFTQIMELSSLSDVDFVHLVAHYNDAFDGEKHKVSSEVQARGYSPEALAHAKKKKSEKFNSVESCGLRFTKPFDHLKFSLMNYVLVLFENYRLGSLPFPGSVSEQPAQIIEIFSVLAKLKQESEIKISESLKKHGRNLNKNKPQPRR